MRTWSVAGLALAMAFSASSANAQELLCAILPDLPFCDPQGCDCGEIDERLDALEAGQVIQNAAIASLAAQITVANNAILELETCCDDNSDAIDDLQDQIDEIVEFLGGDCAIAGLDECDGTCVDTDTDEDNCGDCGVECDANENCVDGACELIVCPDPGECNLAVLNQDGSCTNVPLTGDECDDGLNCTTADSCLNGTCVGGGNPCADGQTCVEGDTPECIPPAP